MHVDNDEKKKKWEILGLTFLMSQTKSKLSNEMETTYLNEEGIYSLLFSFNKKEAKEFQK
jgi:prophage antirepressor-like protein